MPRLPTVDGPSVSLGAAPDAYQKTPTALGAGDMQRASEFAGLGRGIAQLGQTMAREQAEQDRLLKLAQKEREAAYKKEQEEADQVRVDEALNLAREREMDLTYGRERGFTNAKGINALERESGRPLADEYGDQFHQDLNGIEGKLGNERQKRLFRMQANDMSTKFRGQILQYEGKEYQNYKLSVAEGTIENRKREVGLYYNDPARIEGALSSIGAAAAARGRQQGKAAVEIEADARKETSSALTLAVGAALERNDLAYADAFVRRYADRMEADDLLRVRGAIDKQIDAGVAMQAATESVQAVRPQMQPSDTDRFLNITGPIDGGKIDQGKLVKVTMKSESGGKRYGKDGQLLTSPAGAKGEMQVMDATNRNPGFGVAPARDDGPDERARVGRELLMAWVKHYKGDLAKVWGAYNGGPGTLEKAIEAAKKDGTSWLSKMPAETQAYVRKNVAAYNGQGGTQQSAGYTKQPTLEQVHTAVRARVGTENPARLKLALDESTRQFEDAQKAMKQQGNEAVAEMQRWLMSNDGRISMAPAKLREAVVQYAPEEMDNLMQFGDRMHKGEDRTSPEWYQKFSSDDFLKSMSEDQFFTLSTRYLNESDRKHFADRRSKALTGTSSDKPGDLNSSSIKSVLDSRLRELRIDPTPKDGSAEAGRVGAIRKYIDETILRAQTTSGKRLTDAEIIKVVDGAFAQTDVVKTWFGLSEQSKPMLEMKADDIPSSIRSRIEKDFKARGIDDPKDEQILGAYWKAKSGYAAAAKPRPASAPPDTARRQSGMVGP